MPARTPKELIKLYDNTRISDSTCLRYYYYRHYRDFAQQVKPLFYIFGAGWHAAMDVVWKEATVQRSKLDVEKLVFQAAKAFAKKWEEEGGDDRPSDEKPDDRRSIDTALEMLYCYVLERKRMLTSSRLKLLDVERPFVVPLDPADPTRFYVGRLDKVIEWEGKRLIIEHKTTTAYKKNGPFKEDFMDSFSPNNQIDGYFFAGDYLYEGVKAVWVDAALVHRDVHDAFRFIPIERTSAKIEAWLWETRQYIAEIEMHRAALQNKDVKSGSYLAAFPKRTRVCTAFFQVCPMLDVCKAWDNPEKHDTPPGFVLKHWSPFDELKLKELGLKKGDVD